MLTNEENINNATEDTETTVEDQPSVQEPQKVSPWRRVLRVISPRRVTGLCMIFICMIGIMMAVIVPVIIGPPVYGSGDTNLGNESQGNNSSNGQGGSGTGNNPNNSTNNYPNNAGGGHGGGNNNQGSPNIPNQPSNPNNTEYTFRFTLASAITITEGSSHSHGLVTIDNPRAITRYTISQYKGQLVAGVNINLNPFTISAIESGFAILTIYVNIMDILTGRVTEQSRTMIITVTEEIDDMISIG